MITLSGHKTKNKFSFPVMQTPNNEALDGTYPVFADQYKFNPGRILIANIVRDRAYSVPIVEFMAARVIAICAKPPDNANKLKRIDKDLLLSDPNTKKLIRTLWISFQLETKVVCIDEYSSGLTEVRSYEEWSVLRAVRKLQKYISRIESDPNKFVISIIRNNQIMDLANNNNSGDNIPDDKYRSKVRVEVSGNPFKWKNIIYYNEH